MDPRNTGPTTGGSGLSGPAGPAMARASAHDLLLGLAGRLPDRLLWRLRDWLDAGAEAALRTSLPRTLLRHRVAVTDRERALLHTVVGAWGGPLRPVEAILRTDAAPEPAATFEATAGWDSTDLVLRALVPALGEVRELRRTWRTDHAARRAAPAPPVRVVLVRAVARRPEVAGAVARCLRAHGEVPCVEVMADRGPVGPYHDAALAGSDALWVPVPGARRAGPDVASPAELVGHG